MSTTKTTIECLSVEQKAALAEFRRDTISRLNSTNTGDRDSIESAVRALYKAAGKDPPIIFWCSGPTQLLIMPLVLEACSDPDRSTATKDFLGSEVFSKMLNQFNSSPNRMSSFQYRYRFRKAQWGLQNRALQQLWLLARFNEVFESTTSGNMNDNYRHNLLPAARSSIDFPLGESFKRDLDLHTAAVETLMSEHVGTLLKARFRRGSAIMPTATSFSRRGGRLPFDTGAFKGCLNANEFSTSAEPWRTTLTLLINWYSTADSSSLINLIARHMFASTHLSSTLYSKADTRLLQSCWELALQCWSLICQDSVCFVCDRPSLLHVDDQNRLHNSGETAILFRDGTKGYFWHGTNVSADVIEDPESISVKRIEREINAEIRRVLMERYGLSRYLLDSDATKIHEDEFGTLYWKRLRNDLPLVMVKVINSTPEADGSLKEYFLRVPPHIRTAKEAVAWTFALEAEDYNPVVET